jgi:hypothetical protein
MPNSPRSRYDGGPGQSPCRNPALGWRCAAGWLQQTQAGRARGASVRAGGESARGEADAPRHPRRRRPETQRRARERGWGVKPPAQRCNSAILNGGVFIGSRRPTPAADWRARHREALAYWSAFHPADEAAVLAWGEIENHWHMQLGERVPHWQCAGCHEPIGDIEDLVLADGHRVHFETLNCLLRYGERWRVAATRALVAMGLRAPAPMNER